MKRFCVGLVLLMFVLLLPALAYADSIATLDLSASFVPLSPSGGAALFGSGPTLFVTGQFVLDEDTSTISSWNMSFLGPLGATYELSAQNGGVSGASCLFGPISECLSGPLLSNVAWSFFFANSVASLNVETNLGELPFFTGETVQLCAASFTIYPGNVVGEPPCLGTSYASFDNESDVVVYQLPNGFSSGTLTVSSVVSTPEPSESTTLFLGMAIIFGCMIFQKTSRLQGIGTGA
jgi:hypothetical protein